MNVWLLEGAYLACPEGGKRYRDVWEMGHAGIGVIQRRIDRRHAGRQHQHPFAGRLGVQQRGQAIAVAPAPAELVPRRLAFGHQVQAEQRRQAGGNTHR